MITYQEISDIFREYDELNEAGVQKHKSPDTSINQVSAGLTHSVRLGWIGGVNVDHGGGKYDTGKKFVESNVEGSTLHVTDPYNRTPEHNKEVERVAMGRADYVGLHNVLNVIQEPEHRKAAIKKAASFMNPETGRLHITVYQGDRSGNGRVTMTNKRTGETSWQEHRKTSTYVPEVRDVIPENTHDISVSGNHIVVTRKPKQ